MRYLLGFLLVFTVGVLAGWLWRDAQPVSAPVSQPALPGAPALYERGDLDGIVRFSGGNPEVVLQLINGDSSEAALALIERFYASYPADFYPQYHC